MRCSMKQNHGSFSADVPTGDSWAEVVLAVNSTTCTGSPLSTFWLHSLWCLLQCYCHFTSSLERVFAFYVNSNKIYCSVSAGPLLSLMKRRTSCSTTTPPTTALKMIQWLKLSQRFVWTKQHTSVQLQERIGAFDGSQHESDDVRLSKTILCTVPTRH